MGELYIPIIGILIVIIWVIGMKQFNQKIKEKSQIIKETQDSMEDFKVKYLNSLNKLKSNSSNVELKQQTSPIAVFSCVNTAKKISLDGCKPILWIYVSA